MNVDVGIMEAPEVEVVFNGRFNASSGESATGRHTFSAGEIDESPLIFTPESTDGCCFELTGVTIGKEFHWQRKEDQRFKGCLILASDGKRVSVINRLPVEEYLKSVVSSEMKASAPVEFLKAHAVISRSWLLAQILDNGMSEMKSDSADENNTDSEENASGNEIMRWYDQKGHTGFDVCADDHCQRYQGISRISNRNAVEAVEATEGLVLTCDGVICDTRFSKCCGGAFEKFSSCWDDKDFLYLTSGRDMADVSLLPDLRDEKNAKEWISSSPGSFCNISDNSLLERSLNGYDRDTSDFYRWKQEYSAEELAEIVRLRTGMDFGEITDIVPVERGVSGRLIKVKIAGTRRSLTIGKELEIRRTLSRSHLYSSAFFVEKTGAKINENGERYPAKFTFHGAGWGHGVGLCQIGAAAMASQGYGYREILLHYYPGSVLKKITSDSFGHFPAEADQDPGLHKPVGGDIPPLKNQAVPESFADAGTGKYP